jgi:hypothetical protein
VNFAYLMAEDIRGALLMVEGVLPGMLAAHARAAEIGP